MSEAEVEFCQVYLTPKSKFFHTTEMKMRIMMVIVTNAIQHRLTVTEHSPWAQNSQPPYEKLRLRERKYLVEVDKGAAPGFKIRSRHFKTYALNI